MELDNLTPILIGTDRGFVAVRLSKAFEICKKHNIKNIEEEMKEAAKNLDFERAMELRDSIFELKLEL